MSRVRVPSLTPKGRGRWLVLCGGLCRPHKEVKRCYRRLARRYSQMARTTAATKTTTPTPTVARPAAPRAVPIPPNRCPCLRRLALNDATTVTSDKVNTSNPSRRCTKRTGCDPECRGFDSRHSPRRGEGVFSPLTLSSLEGLATLATNGPGSPRAIRLHKDSIKVLCRDRPTEFRETAPKFAKPLYRS